MGARTFVFFTTTDRMSDRAPDLARLLASIEVHRHSDPTPVLHLLLQNAPSFPPDLPAWVRALAVPGRLPLSKARNSLLASMPLSENHIVAFPDDDCWYPPGTLRRIADAFAGDQDLDLLITRYSANPNAGAIRLTRPSLQTLISRASSNTIFVRGSLVAALGPFDERLGLGAPFNGGEDTDYALRASRLARRIGFLDAPLVGHRNPDPALRRRYFSGSLIAIAKHAANSPAALPALLRKICIGAFLALPPADYFLAVRNAVAIITKREPS